LVAFSGTVNYNNLGLHRAQMNGLSPIKQTAEQFKKSDYRVLISGGDISELASTKPPHALGIIR
jgi:hypothetical protein